MKLAEIKIILNVQGPILTGASTAGDPGIDSPFARNHRDELYIPFSLVKGKLREAWTELCGAGISFAGRIESRFGTQAGEGVWDPDRGRLHFTDFVHVRAAQPVESAPPARAKKTSTGIKMDPLRKAGQEGAIQVMEKPFEAGGRAEFAGVCWFFAQDDTEIDSLMADLAVLFSWLTSLGADRTVGFGQFLGAGLDKSGSRVVDIPEHPEAIPPPAEVMDFGFQLLEPFCIAQKRLTQYLFEGSEIIPGGALKGTLGSMLMEMLGCDGSTVDGSLPQPWDALGNHFHEIRFTHAFPSSNSRPNLPPLSLVKFGEGEARDVALEDEPPLQNDSDGTLSAPAFRIDWKDSSAVMTAFGWPKLQRDLRVRHEHDPEKRRAKDEQLFAYESIAPREEVTWRGSLDLSRVSASSRPQVWGCLKTLLALGLHGLGKTKARTGEVAVKTGYAAEVAARDGLFVLTLQTPALLCDPQDAADPAASLFDLYKGVWAGLSSEASGSAALDLVQFFARQSLKGGYLGQRFKARGSYNPFFLTEAGSVFVLKPIAGREAQATERVKVWRNYGLPLPTWVKDRYGDGWRENPFLPENGYGEIAVNLSPHWDWSVEPRRESADV